MQFDFFDGIVYINLAHRKDRKHAIEKELMRLNAPIDKVHLIEGIFDIFNGHRGCAQSHLAALDLAAHSQWDHVLILEDDAVFPYDMHSTISFTKQAWNALPSCWNVLLLGGNVMVARETPYPPLKQVLYAQSCHAYVVNKSYIPILRRCFETSLKLMETDNDYLESQQKKHSIDHQWKQLQTQDHWFVGTIVAQQRLSFSDITHTVYGSSFEDVGASEKTTLLKDLTT